MLQKPRIRLFLVVALVALALLLLPAVASADSVTNNVGPNATVVFPLDGSVRVSYRIMAKNNDGQRKCNAQDATPAILSINVPAGVTASSTSLTFDRCRQLVPVTFTAQAEGFYPVTVTVTDPGPGSYTVSAATFTLHVLPPLDKEAPVVKVTFPNPPQATNGWFVTKPVIGAVTATDKINIASLECTGGTLQGVTGIGTPSVSASIVVDTEGYNLVTCLGRDALNHYGAAPGSNNSANVPIDTEGPVVFATPDPAPNAAGWYNSEVDFTFDGDDDASGTVSCTAPITYSGPDSAAASVNATCTDEAGNVGRGTFDFKYDATPPSVALAPSRLVDANGWYNHTLSVDVAGQDATSGIASCNGPFTYSAPDSAAASETGNCADNAGNVATASFDFKYDATPPVVTLAAGRVPDVNGWYNHSLPVTASAVDGLSGVGTCEAPATYSGPDSAAAVQTMTCTDNAGNDGSGTLNFKYDATAPTVTATPDRAANAAGWYNHALTVTFSGSDDTAGLASCDDPVTYSGPDNAGASVSGICTDKAGNSGNRPFAFKYDATAPQVTAAADRAPDANGWYNHALTVSGTGVDETSGGVSCSGPVSYAGPNGSGLSRSVTCTDAADNLGTGTFNFKYDATPPSVTVTAGRTPDANGWYNHSLPVNVSGQDATSGLASCNGPLTYAAPDSATASETGTCTDNAGNVGTDTLEFKYDATAPSVTVAADRAPDHNGWYTHALSISATATDALSGLASCDGAAGYSGPDSASAAKTMTCTDKAGNAGSGTLNFKYDATGPVVTLTPDHAASAAGWHNQPLTIQVSGVDAASTVASCDNAITYSGPETAAVSVSGKCTDMAGNVGTQVYDFGYDATAPTVTVAPDRPADNDVWYNHALSISASATDDLSGVAACDAPASFEGPDDADAAKTLTCTDKAGNAGSGTLNFKYDCTGPQVTLAASRAADHDGWYNHALTISASAVDEFSGLDACDAPVNYAGPDSAAAATTRTCTDKAGNSATGTLDFKYDATAPSVTAAADRAPDYKDAYVRPLTITFTGADSGSGIAGCSAPITYSGPAALSKSVSGTCTDSAGNASQPAAFTFKFLRQLMLPLVRR